MRPGRNTESIKQTLRCLAEHYVDDLEGRQMMIKHFPIKCRVVKPKNLISLFVNLIISYKGGLRKSQRKLSGMQTLYSATDISASLDKFPAQYDRNPHEVRLRRYYNGCNF